MAKNEKPVKPEVEDQAAIPATPGSSEDKNIVNVVWNFLSSMKLGITLLLVLAIVSIIGTLWIPKDPLTGQQDFTVFYNNFLFKMLLGLLALNLLVCSLNRWKSVVSTLKGPKVDFSENFVKNLKSKSSIQVNAGTTEVAEQVKGLLKKRGYRVFASQDGDVVKIASDRGHWGILGPYLTHLSFIVMIVAVVIKFSGLVGFEGQLVGMVGQTYSLGDVQGIQNMDPADYFNVRIDNFRTDYRPDGSVKQWYSDVTVIDKGTTFPFSIYVNRPLVHNGVKFYQMSYGSQFGGKVSGPQFKDQAFTAGPQDYLQPPGSNITFQPLTYDSDAKKVLVNVFRGQQQVAQESIALNTPYKMDQAEISFDQAVNYTVLSVKRDPGVPYIGAGSLLLVLGVMISFLFRQRRVWSLVAPDKGGSSLVIGGISAKDKRGLENDLEKIVDEIEE